jgi:hypothetical protein
MVCKFENSKASMKAGFFITQQEMQGIHTKIKTSGAAMTEIHCWLRVVENQIQT